MKSKVLVIVLVLIIVALLIILGFKLFEKEPKDTLPMEAQPMEAQQRVPQEIWIPDDHSEEGKDIVRAHIADIEEQLAAMSGELTMDTIKLIREFFVHEGRSFVVKHDGELVMGPAFPGYLTSNQDHISEIKFELQWFVSEEFTAEQWDLADFFHFVHFGFKVSYVYDGELMDPPGGGDDYHIRDCTWRTR